MAIDEETMERAEIMIGQLTIKNNQLRGELAAAKADLKTFTHFESSPTPPPAEGEDRCPDCNGELSQCGEPNEDGEPYLDCRVWQQSATIADLREQVEATLKQRDEVMNIRMAAERERDEAREEIQKGDKNWYAKLEAADNALATAQADTARLVTEISAIIENPKRNPMPNRIAEIREKLEAAAPAQGSEGQDEEHTCSCGAGMKPCGIPEWRCYECFPEDAAFAGRISDQHTAKSPDHIPDAGEKGKGTADHLVDANKKGEPTVEERIEAVLPFLNNRCGECDRGYTDRDGQDMCEGCAGTGYRGVQEMKAEAIRLLEAIEAIQRREGGG